MPCESFHEDQPLRVFNSPQMLGRYFLGSVAGGLVIPARRASE